MKLQQGKVVLVSTGAVLLLYVVRVFMNTSVSRALITSIPRWHNGYVFNQTFDKWIVVTTISKPTDDIKYIAGIQGWKLIVVGDIKTPTNWSYPNVTYISIEDQKNLPFETIPLIPTGSYARKIIGYLYAIANGAQVIYETDDDNRPLDKLKKFQLDQNSHGLQYSGENIFNPYRHFGQPSLWPRGYPLDKIGQPHKMMYAISEYSTPLIQQGLVNGDPDMDALFRLTRKSTKSMLNVSFDGVAPPVSVPVGVFSPFNSQNTLFLYNALWAMVLPTSTTFRVCDIWRGYWAQRLLWEIGGTLGFYSPNAFQKRNSHSYMSDAKEEEDLYFKGTELVHFLSSWKCDQELSFFQCVKTLTLDMVEREFWEMSDYNLISTWINDLIHIGYKEPKRQKQKENPKTPDVHFHPSEQTFPRINNRNVILKSKWNQVQGITSFCNNSTYNINKNSLSFHSFPNILLIIVFNFPIYDNIPYLQLLYGVTFTHIVYCGNDIGKFQKASKKFKEPVTFVEADVNRGYFVYRCVSKAMKMNYDVNGYLMIGDDTLLNTWSIPKYDLNKIWFHYFQLLNRDKGDGWHWWNGGMGRSVVNKAWDELLKTSRKNNSKEAIMVSHFLNTLAKNTKSKLSVYHSASDIVYIPTRFREETIYFMDLFSKYKIFLEIVFPTLVTGLELRNNIVVLPGQYLWYDGKRERVPSIFNSEHIFLHPVKLSQIVNKLHPFFCNTIFPLTLNSKK